ncbi:MAG: glycosyltransferase, partial [Anaerolineae bacterium]
PPATRHSQPKTPRIPKEPLFFMKVTLLTIGSRGDVQPYIPLGLGLQQAGYDVRIATHETFRAFITGHGLDFAPIASNPMDLLESEEGQAWLQAGQNPLKFIRHFTALTLDRLDEMFTTSLAACQDSGLILFSMLGVAGYHIAESLGIPAAMAMLQPFTPTRAFPAVGALTFPLPFGQAQANFISHQIGEQVLWLPFRKKINKWRTERLGLRPLPFFGPYKQMKETRFPLIYGYSPALIPKPADWGEHIRVTGYWFLPTKAEWQPPADLAAFLAGGPPPVYIGFGSMVDRDPEGLRQLVLEALAELGLRAVLLSGWAKLGAGEVPDSVCVVESVPHDWLFDRVTTVVHHGGAGTTAAGLRAGVPSVVTPYFADQYFWGDRVTEAGVGPTAVPRNKLTVPKLAAALEQAVNDAAMRQKAARLGQKIRAEDGVSEAVCFVQSLAE